MSTRPSNAATPAANAASKSSTPLNNQTPLNATPQPAPPSKVVTNSALSVSFAPSVVDGVGQPAASTITAASSTPAPFGSVAPALNALDYYLKKAPDAHYVSLQGFDLVDVAPVLPGLSRLRGMRHLNLAHNALWRLPDDLSMLSSLERLDLTKNRFATASLMLKGLFSLRNLKHLHVHLPEAEEEILVASLASLKTLNGIPLDDADAPDLATMASKVVAAPASSVLNTSSPAAGLDAMQASAHASGTATPMPDMPAARLPSAKELDDEHRQALLQEHRGYDTTTGAAGRYNLLPWTFETSQQYKTLQLLCAKVSGNASNTAEFEEFHAMVVSHLKARIRSEAGDVLRHQVHQFHASSLLLEYCNEEVSRASGKYGAELSTALKALAAAHLQTMQQASAIMMAMQDDRDRKIAALQKDLAAALMVHEHTRVNVAQSDGFEADFLKSMEDERKMADRKGFVMDRRELNTVIEGIVSSKIKHDEANSLAKIPNETMEQHVYTYFTERLGSTEAIRSAVASVLNSLAAHEKFDIDVAVFAKIIHLELDEEYWTLHKLLSTVIYDSVHNVLAGRGRERAAVDVFTGRLNSYQIEEVVNAIFPQEDNGWRNRGIVAYARTLAEERGEELSSLTSTTIGYRDFAFILLRQTLERRLKDIEPLTVRFRELDREHNGVIDAVQMRMLIHDLAPGLSTQKEREILHAVDPFGNNIITFSDAVSLLVAHQDYWWMTERGRASNDKSNPRRRKVDVHELWEENRETASRSPPRTARSPAREAASALGRRRR